MGAEVMARLLDELIACGELDKEAARWARAHRAMHGGTVETALLELELIDEEALQRGLASCFGLTAATRDDLAPVTPNLAERFPPSFCKSLFMCPLRREDGQLTVLVRKPLPDKWLTTLQQLGLQVTQLIAPTHYLALVWEQVHGTPMSERSRALEARLARHQEADMRSAVHRLEATPTVASAVAVVLDYGAAWVDICCFLVVGEREMRVAAARGWPHPESPFPIPSAGCSLGAALRYGGYFVGPVAGTEADHELYKALERRLPRRALVAPVQLASGFTALLYCDNGPRGLAPRFVAELTLLAARLGRHAGKLADEARARSPQPSAHPEPSDPPPGLEGPAEGPAEDAPEQAGPQQPGPQQAVPTLTTSELAAVARLQRTASESGMAFEALVDELLRARGAQDSSGMATALAEEVKGLFEKLATDIPTQLARGMESAFRDIVPRLGPDSGPAARPAAPAAIATPNPVSSPSANVELVQTKAAPREVGNYRARRRKSARVKL